MINIKILIIGSEGQLGRELSKLLRTNYSPLGDLPQVFKNIDLEATSKNVLDITNQAQLLSYINNSNPNVIINCSAYTNVDDCEINQDKAFMVNALGAKNLAIAAKEIDAKVVNISTDYVFSGKKNSPYNEWDICEPQNVYGHTKYLGERYTEIFCKNFFIIRTAWLYSTYGNNFVNTILNSAKIRNELKVVNDQIGNPTNIQDLAYHILKIVSTDNYGIYHCTCKGECSWFDLANEIIRLTNLNCKILPCSTAEYPIKTKRPLYSSMNNCMLNCTIGDNMRTWKDALSSFIENYSMLG